MGERITSSTREALSAASTSRSHRAEAGISSWSIHRSRPSSRYCRASFNANSPSARAYEKKILSAMVPAALQSLPIHSQIPRGRERHSANAVALQNLSPHPKSATLALKLEPPMERIPAAEAERNLADLLNRVRDEGASFEIVRGDEVVACIVAPKPAPKITTVGDFLKALEKIPPLDPAEAAAFEADLEAIRKEFPAPESKWD